MKIQIIGVILTSLLELEKPEIPTIRPNAIKKTKIAKSSIEYTIMVMNEIG